MSALGSWYDQMWRTFHSEQPDVQIVLLPDSPLPEASAPSAAELDQQAADLGAAAGALAAALGGSTEPLTDCRITLDRGLRLRKRLTHIVAEPSEPDQLVAILTALGWQVTQFPAKDLLWFQGQSDALDLQLTEIDGQVDVEVFGPRHAYSDELRTILEGYCQ